LIRVSEKTYGWLDSHGKVTDTFDDVIQRLIKFYEEGGLPYSRQR
jgi:hypothetical protein